MSSPVYVYTDHIKTRHCGDVVDTRPTHDPNVFLDCCLIEEAVGVEIIEAVRITVDGKEIWHYEEPKVQVPVFCAVCAHQVHQTGSYDWHCDEGCRCLMQGCVLDKERQANDEASLAR